MLGVHWLRLWSVYTVVHSHAGAGGQGPGCWQSVVSRMRAMAGISPPLGHCLLFLAGL